MQRTRARHEFCCLYDDLEAFSTSSEHTLTIEDVMSEKKQNPF